MLEPSLETVYYLSLIGIFVRFLIPVTFLYFTFVFRASLFEKQNLINRAKIMFLPAHFSKNIVSPNEGLEFSKFLSRRLVLICVICISSLYNGGLYLYLDKVVANGERCRLEKDCDYHKKSKPCKGKGDVACR